MISLTSLYKVGAMSDVAAISVTDSAISHTITANKRTILFQNQGTQACYCGGSTVDANNNRGYELLPKASLQFENTTNEFKVYFVCATSGTTTIGVIECD